MAPNRQAAFATSYLHGALLAGVAGGFPLAAYLGSHLGFGLSLSAATSAIIQAHGMAQTMGWLGLFIMGVSLHFLPRLSGVAIPLPHWILPVPGWLMAAAILLRLGAQPTMMLVPQASWPGPALMLSGVLLPAGAALYVLCIAATLRHRDTAAPTHATIAVLRPWLALVLAGWLGSTGLLGWGAMEAGLSASALLRSNLQAWGIELFLGAVLVPVAFVFARQVLPLYLRTNMVPPHSLPWLALAYAGAMIVRIVASAMDQVVWRAAGEMAQAAVIVAMFGALRIHRRRAVRGTSHPSRDGSTRYGDFAPAIYLSFGFLLLAALAQFANAAAELVGIGRTVPMSGIRHLYLAGFGNLLLLGVAPRMVPGFLGARGPAWPHLVRPMWLLGVVAAAGVALGLSLPWVLQPAAVRWLFGLSGSLGWIAAMLLAGILWTTCLRRAG